MFQPIVWEPQSLDISVSKAAKDYLRWQFLEWYSNQLLKQLDKGNEVKDQQTFD